MRKKSKTAYEKLDRHTSKRMNEIFSTTYQEIERQKVNKISYLNIIYHVSVLFYSLKIARKRVIFARKTIKFFSQIDISESHYGVPRIVFAQECVTFISLQNGKKNFEKKFVTGGQNRRILSLCRKILIRKRAMVFPPTRFS